MTFRRSAIACGTPPSKKCNVRSQLASLSTRPSALSQQDASATLAHRLHGRTWLRAIRRPCLCSARQRCGRRERRGLPLCQLAFVQGRRISKDNTIFAAPGIDGVLGLVHQCDKALNTVVLCPVRGTDIKRDSFQPHAAGSAGGVRRHEGVGSCAQDHDLCITGC